MTSGAAATKPSAWPRRPQPVESDDALRSYLEHYRGWIRETLEPEVIEASLGLHSAFKREELLAAIEKRWRKLIPHGHGVNSTTNELGQIGYALANAPWFAAEASAAAREVLARADGLHDANPDTLREVTRAHCAWTAPLHAAESVVRHDAAKSLAAMCKGLPTSEAIAVMSLQQIKHNGQEASRSALLAEVHDAGSASHTAVKPPVAPMQRAWFRAVWPLRKHKVESAMSLATPELRAAYDAWLDDLGLAYPWIDVNLEYTDDELAEWEAYKDALADQVSRAAFGDTSRGRRRNWLEELPGVTEEIAQDAVGLLLSRIAGHHISRGPYASSVRTMLRNAVKDVQREALRHRRRLSSGTVVDADGGETSIFDLAPGVGASAHESAVESAVFDHSADEPVRDRAGYRPCAPIHVHLVAVLAAEVERGAAPSAELLRDIAEDCADAPHAHDSDVARELARARARASMEDLADEVLHHMAEAYTALASHPHDGTIGLGSILDALSLRAGSEGKRHEPDARPGPADVGRDATTTDDDSESEDDD